MYKLSEASKERLEGVDSRLLEIIDLALTISKIDFGIPRDGGIRTPEQQNKLFNDGLSKCDGYEKKSHFYPFDQSSGEPDDFCIRTRAAI